MFFRPAATALFAALFMCALPSHASEDALAQTTDGAGAAAVPMSYFDLVVGFRDLSGQRVAVEGTLVIYSLLNRTGWIRNDAIRENIDVSLVGLDPQEMMRLYEDCGRSCDAIIFGTVDGTLSPPIFVVDEVSFPNSDSSWW